MVLVGLQESEIMCLSYQLNLEAGTSFFTLLDSVHFCLFEDKSHVH